MTVLNQRWRKPRSVSLVPLIDILFILLIYFMVTSVYLDLDMIPVSETAKQPMTARPADTALGATLLLRIDRSGDIRLRGQSVAPDTLGSVLADEVARDPGTSVSILPSPYAPVQALATALDALAKAGVTRSRILQLEARTP